MGIVNSGIPANPNLDQYNLANNYGVQPANRKQIFNAAYSIELGNPVQRQDRRRLPQRLAALRYHATAERRQPHGIQLKRQLRHEPEWRQNPGRSARESYGNQCQQRVAAGDERYPAQPHADVQSDRAGSGRISSSIRAVSASRPRSARMARPYSRRSTDRPSSTPIWDFSRTSSSRSRRSCSSGFNGTNFLNHPLWSFNGSNLTLGFDPNTGKVNTPLFGTVTQKQGHRIIQAAIKFYF